MGHQLRLLATASVVLSVLAGMSDAAAPRSPQTTGGIGRLSGKQLFIDNHVIDDMKGLTKVLNRPIKHPRNPLAVPDLPWEEHGFYANGTVIYDKQDKLFKAWVHLWKHKGKELAATTGLYAYMTSSNGVAWKKPLVNKAEKTNRILPPDGDAVGFAGQGVMKDVHDDNPARRYKMLYNSEPDGTSKSLQIGAAYSPDGIRWTAESRNPLIPFGDTQSVPLWDPQRRSYLGFVRTGPPNIRGIARIESRDFAHWSPKVTIFKPGEDKLDQPFRSVPYGMKVLPYAGCFIGLINMYNWETLGPIPKDKLFQDKVNVQMAFSRNGITWNRVGSNGVIPFADLSKDLDWETIARKQVFLQYGKHKKEWDWGQLYAYQAPVVFNDRIWIYYTGLGSRHWSNYHGDDRPPKSGIGLATLRLDGFVSVQPVPGSQAGILTTRPFVFLGNRILVNADASKGSLRVEVLEADGDPIDGFTVDDCRPFRGDDLRHVLRWNDRTDCRQIQGRPIRLRFHLERSKLFSFTPSTGRSGQGLAEPNPDH